MSRDTVNSRRYRFDDFTHEQYRRLLDLARQRYAFRLYDDFRPDETFVLWRHDLDFSISDALPLARMEADAGIRATYFVHLNGDFYNPLTRENLDQLGAIAALGHAIGLHFDFGHHRIADEATLRARLRADAERLRAESGLPVRAFSFHNPGPSALAYDGESYEGLVNTYSRYFRRDVAYCSDSNGHWAHERLAEVLERTPQRPLQVLTHPTWWSAEVMSPRQKIEAAAAAAATSMLDRYTAALAAAGRPDIDW